MRQTSPLIGLVAQLTLLAVLAETSGLGATGWLVGVICALTMATALQRGLTRRPGEDLTRASWVTLARASLGVGVAALVVDSFTSPTPVVLLVALAAVALAMDLADGWLARRTGTTTTLGARFDGEVDAFLILALSVHVASALGTWVLAIGAARYLFLLGEWLLPWMRAPLPPRRWRKLVAAAQGIVLTVAAAEALPRELTRVLLAVALALLAASFGQCVWWLWRHRHAVREEKRETEAGRHGSRAQRTGRALALTVAALVTVWVALVAPNHPSRLTPDAFVRLPLELLALVGLAVLLPAAARRALAMLGGALLSALVLVKFLDMGFFMAFDRPFDLVYDWGYAGIGIETLGEAIGRSRAALAAAVVVVLGIVLLVLPALALRRVTRVAAAHRHRVLPAAATLVVVWAVLRVLGAPVASTSATALAVREVRAVANSVQAREVLLRDIGRDAFRATPGADLLTRLRGKDVLLVFVESYGRIAVEGASISPEVNAVLDRGTSELRADGFAARSAFLTSPTFGGISWLAHATLQAGVWIDGRWRHDQLVQTDRLTLSRAFKRAGWRTLAAMPANNRTWRVGSTFYRFDQVYDRRNVGYRGPRFGLPTMPDQYVLHALHRDELAKRRRPPIFAEVDLLSSHAPWTDVPPLIAWDDIGDGSVFRRLPAPESAQAVAFSDTKRARAAYGRAIRYSLNTVISFVRRHGDERLVLVVVGDHQPATIVSGHNAGHDVPVSVIARDPGVFESIAGWKWEAGLRPSPRAPVWRMDAFRDHFLRAFGSTPASG